MLHRVFFLSSLLLVVLNAAPAQITAGPCESSQFTAHDSFATTGTSTPGASSNSVSWKAIPSNVWHDQVSIYWECPRKLVRDRNWIPLAAVLGTTAALIATDQYDAPYFRRTSSFHGLNSALSGTNTTLIVAAVPAALYVTGLVRKDAFAQSTAFRTGEAIADSEIAAELLKVVTRRKRPRDIPVRGNFGDTWLDSSSIGAGGFPSGHTVAAFSAAAVLSGRYGRTHRWVPFVAYGAATTIGFSRVTLSSHNVSDVFVGAALGYAISHFVVLHRFNSR